MSPSITFALFRRVTAKAIRPLYVVLLAGIVFSCAAELLFAQSLCVGCGRRIAVLPWYAGGYAAGQGVWETELRSNAGPSDGVEFGYLPAFALTYDGLGRNLLLTDEHGPFIAEEVDSIRLGGRRSYRSTISGEMPDNGVATGSLLLFFDSPDAAALENASADAIYRHFTSDWTLDFQVAAPVVFLDQASSEWSASITEIPGTSSTTMFAVANLSIAQAVRVEVFNGSGQLLASAKTPVLAGATGSLGDIGGVGGVHGAYLARLPGINLPEGPIRGTLVFKGDGGGKIAPVVFQTSGSVTMSLPVRPARIP